MTEFAAVPDWEGLLGAGIIQSKALKMESWVGKGCFALSFNKYNILPNVLCSRKNNTYISSI